MIKDLFETGKEALTIRRAFYISLTFAVFTFVATWAPQIQWHGEPVFLNVPGWTWGVMAGCLTVAWFFLRYANTLRLELVPKIELYFDKYASCIVQTPERFADATGQQVFMKNATYVNIRANALSSTTVKDCAAFLTGIETLEYWSFKPIAMPDVIILKQSFNISPKVPQMISVLRASETDNLLRFASSWPLLLDNVFEEEATYRLTVVVVAGGISHEIQFDVIWNGKWNQIDGKPAEDVFAF